MASLARPGRRDLYQRLTEQVLETMKTADPSDWRPPWTLARQPVNALTGRPYSGINILALALSKIEAGHQMHRWATYRQWQKLDAQVKKGQKGTSIVFARQLIPTRKPGTAAILAPDRGG